MSQITSAGASVSNITPWNRTPGKPGPGSGNSAFGSNRWSNSKSSSNTGVDPKRDTTMEERMDKTVVGTQEAPHMWPSLFDAPRVGDATSTVFATNAESVGSTNQWSVPTFTGSAGSNPLISTTDCIPSSAAWSQHSTGPNCSIVPRAITGQQMNHSNVPVDADPTRRFLIGATTSTWPLASDSSDLLGDDSSHLSLALSKMNMNNAVPPAVCFQSAMPDFTESQLMASVNSQKPGDSSSDSHYESRTHNNGKPNVENVELDRLFSSDPEESIRSVVNTTEAWGVHPVDQSTPWDTSDLLGDVGHPGVSPVSDSTATHVSAAHPANLFDSTSSTVSQSRRLGGSAIARDLESNVWPSEPPNGTGIWESHYESLGERTARWQQNISGSAVNQPGFTSHQTGHHTGFGTGPVPATRTQLLSSGPDNATSLRGFTRPNLGALLGNSGASTKPISGLTLPIGGSSLHNTPSPTGSSRGFSMTAGNPNLGGFCGPWPFPPGASTNDSVIGNKSRWPNPNLGRLTGKPPPQQQQQPQPVAHLPTQSGSGMHRWPPMNNAPHVPAGWPVTDPRRPNVLPGSWANSGPNDSANYFGQPHHILPPVTRMCQPGSMSTEFPTPSLVPTPRGSTATANQAFRSPHSAFYPTMNSNFASGSVPATQRAFLSPQQHSQQLQQQSVLRANAMRQLVNLGFPDEEVQTIFSDINTNVERALMDLRDRTCHPGLDEMIKSFANSGLMQLSSLDDGLCTELSRLEPATAAGTRPLALRSTQHPNTALDHALSKSGNLPSENLDLSIHMMQQRETQILQTIMQLQSKHQELNQKLNPIRSVNLPFVTNPVMQELQLQAIQVASQIDAQHAQLKQIRSQTGILKQLAAQSHSSSHLTTNALLNATGSSSSAFTSPLTSSTTAATMWLTPTGTSIASTATVMCAPVSGAHQSSLLGDNPMAEQCLDPPPQDQGWKLGSGSLLWEAGPWSGASPRASFDPYSTADRRWSPATFLNRPPYGALGDPRWADLASDITTGAMLAESQRLAGDTESASSVEDGTLGRRSTNSRSWLLAHNIPPHVSVSVLKMAVSTALMTHRSKGLTHDKIGEPQLDFELHPNMSARWVLIGLANASDASVAHDYLESSGGEQNGAHYGSIKAISPAEAMLRLQDIQSLASRFKSFSVADGPTIATSNPRSGAQSLLNFGASGASDLSNVVSGGGGVNLESINHLVNAAGDTTN